MDGSLTEGTVKGRSYLEQVGRWKWEAPPLRYNSHSPIGERTREVVTNADANIVCVCPGVCVRVCVCVWVGPGVWVRVGGCGWGSAGGGVSVR